MSMPCFPQSGLNITEEQAFNMLLASIAMEELSLSHIMNAEGEKLQYVLGTLPGSPGACATTQELLAVNKSITTLLDSVMQNQMMLKGKLERVLEGKEQCFNRPCPSPCDPCHPYHPCRPCPMPCGNAPEYISLSGGCQQLCWKMKEPFPWHCCHKKGDLMDWCESAPSLISLTGGHTYEISFCFHFKNCVSSEICIVSQEETGCISLPVQTFKCCSDSLIGSAVFTVADCQKPSIFFSLCKPEQVCVTYASLTILPI